MAYFGIEDETFGLYILILETLIIITISLALMEARKLRLSRHRALMISAYLVQATIVFFWMARKFVEGYSFLSMDPLSRWNIFLHVGIGTTVAFLATGWIIAILVDPEINVAKAKRAKPLMRTIYSLWVFNFLLGLFNYLNRYHLQWI